MSDRFAYLFRRLLLIPPTFIGITMASFLICQIVPGGPVQQYLYSMRGGGHGGGEGVIGSATGEAVITEDLKKEIEKQFGFDKPIAVRYYNWLTKSYLGLGADSYKYNNKTVWQLIKERFPISLTFGISSFLLTYMISIPLGIAKALRSGARFDLFSSVFVFVLYAIPSFAFGMILKTLFCGTNDMFWDFFPISGFRSENWETLSLIDKVFDQTHHMFLPVVCYVIGNFAFLTLLQKNSLLDQINQDYVRTVLAKGGTLRRAVWFHALRNSLIPVVTGIGSILTLMFASSVLIEKVFNINGIGLLSLDAIVSRDYMVFMGILSITSLLGLFGRILSDFCYMIVDPRINFAKS